MEKKVERMLSAVCTHEKEHGGVAGGAAGGRPAGGEGGGEGIGGGGTKKQKIKMSKIAAKRPFFAC